MKNEAAGVHGCVCMTGDTVLSFISTFPVEALNHASFLCASFLTFLMSCREQDGQARAGPEMKNGMSRVFFMHEGDLICSVLSGQKVCVHNVGTRSHDGMSYTYYIYGYTDVMTGCQDCVCACESE